MTLLPALRPARARRPRRTPRHSRLGALRVWTLLSLLLAVAIAAAAWHGLQALEGVPLHVVIDGEDIAGSWDVADLAPGARLMLCAGLSLTVMFLLLLVPLVLGLALSVAVIALVAGVGLPLLAVGLVLALLSAPLWITWGFIALGRRRRAANDALNEDASARMNA